MATAPSIGTTGRAGLNLRSNRPTAPANHRRLRPLHTTLGRLMSRKDAEGRTISFEYDFRNRVTAIRYPDGSAERFDYGQDKMVEGNCGHQPANLLIAYTDRNGNVQRFEYDRTKRLCAKIMAAGKPEEVRELYTMFRGRRWSRPRCSGVSRPTTNGTGAIGSQPLSYIFPEAEP